MAANFSATTPRSGDAAGLIAIIRAIESETARLQGLKALVTSMIEDFDDQATAGLLGVIEDTLELRLARIDELIQEAHDTAGVARKPRTGGADED